MPYRKSKRFKVSVRYAKVSDVHGIYSLGMSDSVFTVSERIRFYEKTELKQWARRKSENILLVLTVSDSIIGFLYCKIMSGHWAILDNIYVAPSNRNIANSKLLIDYLRKELRKRKIDYLTCLIKTQHKTLLRLANRVGFRVADNYYWCELFLTRDS
jgi:L-amino acid N-acyltransferase YncA